MAVHGCDKQPKAETGADARAIEDQLVLHNLLKCVHVHVPPAAMDATDKLSPRMRLFNVTRTVEHLNNSPAHWYEYIGHYVKESAGLYKPAIFIGSLFLTP